jgi:hypothetical protein
MKIIIILFTIFLLNIFMASAVSSTETITPTKDTYVYTSLAWNLLTYSNYALLKTKYDSGSPNYETYLYYDLSNIPTDKFIEQAILHVYTTNFRSQYPLPSIIFSWVPSDSRDAFHHGSVGIYESNCNGCQKIIPSSGPVYLTTVVHDLFIDISPTIKDWQTSRTNNELILNIAPHEVSTWLDIQAIGTPKPHSLEITYRDALDNCGDGVVDLDEECDGGCLPGIACTPVFNNNNGCSSTCEKEPIAIYDCEDLQNIVFYHDYYLANNINCNVAPYNTGEGFNPIQYFNGNFDGGIYSIKNLYINRSSEDLVGLFEQVLVGTNIRGVFENTELKNIRLEDANIIGRDRVGAVAGYIKSNTTNVYVSGNITGNNKVGGIFGEIGPDSRDILIKEASANVIVNGIQNVGGIAGVSSKIINRSYSEGNITGTDSVGGLAGYQEETGTIYNSYSIARVNGDDNIGGLVGYNKADIFKSYSKGDITGTGYNIGGLTGYNTVYVDIENCYSLSNVYGGTYVGGLIGYNYEGRIKTSYSTGLVSGSSQVHGFVGWNFGRGICSNTLWDTQSSGTTHNHCGGGDSTTRLKLQSNLQGYDFDFTDIWGIDGTEQINKGYAYIKDLDMYELIPDCTSAISKLNLGNDLSSNDVTHFVKCIDEKTNTVFIDLVKEWIKDT